mgnify:CR=1 FL=1
MKYLEFEREVEREGFNVDRKSGTAYVDSTTDTVMSISTDDLFMFDCDWSAFVHLNRDVQEQLFDLAYQLAKTPLAEREEEKLYRVKFPSITRWGNAVYLQKDTSDKDPIGVDWSPEDFIFYEKPTDYIFTEQEIKDIDERYLAFKVEVTPE